METRKNQQAVAIRLQNMSEGELDTLHAASLSILDSTGVNVHSPALRDKLQKAGATVEGDLLVRIPAELVDKALESAPSSITLYNRSGDEAMVLEGTNIYFGTGSDLQYTLDPETGERRENRLDDIVKSTRLCDRLEHIDFVMSYGLPCDVSGSDTEIEQFRVMLEHTRKPLIMTLYSGLDVAEEMHKLACSYCGGEEAFRAKPTYIMYGQFVSPLQHDLMALDRLAFYAEHHVPLIYVPTIMMGASGPTTLAGAIALANAECLAGLVMHQLCSPGAPFIYGGCISPLDLRTTAFSYASPEWRIADAALSQLSLRYGLPIFGTAGASDSKCVDAQAGAEWGYSLMLSALAGTNLIHDVGYMESGMCGSLEALVICNEIVGIVKRIAVGFRIDAETLALDVTHRVGPAGHFMEEDHTLDHMRSDIWYPTVFDRDRYEGWMAGNKTDLVQRARDKAAELLRG